MLVLLGEPALQRVFVQMVHGAFSYGADVQGGIAVGLGNPPAPLVDEVREADPFAGVSLPGIHPIEDEVL